MRINRFFLLFLLLQTFLVNAQNDSIEIRKIFNQVLTKSKSFERLRFLSKEIGGRLSGSKEAELAVYWAKNELLKEGFDSVWLQEVMVPHWVRGKKEVASLKDNNGSINVQICALGNSVSTPKKGLIGKIIEVQNFKQLQDLGEEKVKGKIVFFNRPMNPLFIRTFEAYGDAADQRSNGAIEAAKLGAIGVVVRSLGSNLDNYPHTGAMRYQNDVVKIPACAISTSDANLMSEKLKSDSNLLFFFKQNCEMLSPAKSYNVVAQLNGTEFPNEIILVGGHLDSWDLGEGAQDDGAGCVQSMDVLSTFKSLNIKPKRTLRCVLFMNEENGLKGGLEYALKAKENNEKHLFAIETDAGGFTPRNFSTTATEESLDVLKQHGKLLKPYGIEEIISGGGGADISPLKSQGTVLIGFGPDSQRYFDIHHTANDTFDQVSKRELELGSGCITSLVWLLSEYGLNYGKQ